MADPVNLARTMEKMRNVEDALISAKEEVLCNTDVHCRVLTSVMEGAADILLVSHKKGVYKACMEARNKIDLIFHIRKLKVEAEIARMQCVMLARTTKYLQDPEGFARKYHNSASP